MKKIRITIKNDGRVTMRVEGAVGEECLSFTKAFEQAVGEVEERELLPEHNVDPLNVRPDVEEQEQVTDF